MMKKFFYSSLLLFFSLEAMVQEQDLEDRVDSMSMQEEVPVVAPFTEATRRKVQHHIFKQKLEEFGQEVGVAQLRELEKPSCFICYAWEEGVDPMAHFCVQLSRLLQASGINSITAIEHNTHESLVRFAETWFRRCESHPNHKILLVGSQDLVRRNETPGSIVRFEIDAIDRIMSADESKVVLVLQEGTEQDSFPARFHRKPYVDFTVSGSGGPLCYGTLDYVQRFIQLMGRFLNNEEKIMQGLHALERKMESIIESFSWSPENQDVLRQIEEKEREAQFQLRQRGQQEGLQIAQALLLGQEISQDFFLAI
jgi:hypothetical protein